MIRNLETTTHARPRTAPHPALRTPGTLPAVTETDFPTAREPARPPDNAGVLVLDPTRTTAAVFGAEALLTDASTLRAAAWKEVLDSFLIEYAHTTGRRRPAFDIAVDHPAYLLGRLGEEGAVDFLQGRGCRPDLAAGHLGPPPADVLRLLLARAERRFAELVQERGVGPRSGARDLLLDLRSHDVATAAVWTGYDGRQLLRCAGLGHLVDTCTDAEDARTHRLAGPPDPAMLLHTLSRLHAQPERTALIAVTPDDVLAGRRGRLAVVAALGHGERGRPSAAQSGVLVVPGLNAITVAPREETRAPTRT
ncbi:HAD family phosphatase [Wenjunlia tyrosinilytica]|uniref:Uncharacterized protein n=1 Tax=Wenjunlia tyrosinilytica TaxID=1544741 RepID=A0A917ZT77_9ACTN|nr:HAD family phosphatase [Wenjunlia tyrosinilytica]GGO90461.1 hypothetical protein GCM10012280_36070 [Wenjunlia tyrosinilytica]